MTIVIDNEHASGLPARLEAPLDSLERRQGCGGARALDAEAIRNGHRGKRVLEVMAPRHREQELAERLRAVARAAMNAAPAAEAPERDVTARNLRARGSHAVRHDP